MNQAFHHMRVRHPQSEIARIGTCPLRCAAMTVQQHLVHILRYTPRMMLNCTRIYISLWERLTRLFECESG
jgi:hypothetical protein